MIFSLQFVFFAFIHLQVRNGLESNSMSGDISEYFEEMRIEKNVGQDERWLSMFASGVLMATGLMRGSPLFVIGSVGLAFRAISGHCPVYGAIGHTASGSSRCDVSREDKIAMAR
jgi:hypothetical protein